MNSAKVKSIIFTVATNDYTNYLENFLLSLNSSKTNTYCFVTLINTPKDKANYYQTLYDNVSFDFKYFNFKSIDDQKGFAANLRAQIFIELMNKFPQSSLVWVDVDSIFLKNCNELLSLSKKFDFSCQYNEPKVNFFKNLFSKKKLGPLGTHYYGYFSAGVITTNNSYMAKIFFNHYYKLVQIKPFDWFSDQEALYLTYAKYKESIKFRILEWQYCSRVLDKKSFIWTAKSNIKHSDEYYLQNLRLYSKLYKWKVNKLPKISKNNLNNKDNNFIVFLKRVKLAIKVLINGYI